MFSKIALNNVKKSMRDYTVYFLTLSFGVCLFYIFNSIESQTAMLEISKRQNEMLKLLSQVMNYVSVFISVILGFLIIYANKFLIKRRNKELGIYMLLGMKRGKIAKILVLETFVIGLFSLGVGLLVGIFLAQGLSVVTAGMFNVNMKDFIFTFSPDAAIKSVIYFGIIFAVVMIFNTIIISKCKLIDLLYGAKKNENLHIKKLWVSVSLFLISVVCLVIAYWLIIDNGMLYINKQFWASIILGTIGTVLFFMSLSGFLLRVVKSNKRLYFKNLNMFVLRQINSKINTTFVSMSLICLMLLLAIGILSSSAGLTNALTGDMQGTTPFDVTFSTYSFDRNQSAQNPLPAIDEKGIDYKAYISDYCVVNYYYTDLMFIDFIKDKAKISKNDIMELEKMPINVIKLSEYNKALEMQGKRPTALAENEYLFTCNYKMAKDYLNDFMKGDRKITLKGKTLTAQNTKFIDAILYSVPSKSDSGSIIVNDSMIDNEYVKSVYVNMNYKNDTDQTDEAFQTLFDNAYPERSESPYNYMQTRKGIYDQGAGIKIIVTYLGLYVGLVFLITSAAVLALQQLSAASDNIERYRLLRKIGTDERQISHSILTQILIYFFMPLCLALIHSAVGIYVANSLIELLGKINILQSSIFAAGIIVLVYGGYCLATYFGSKSILKTRE